MGSSIASLSSVDDGSLHLCKTSRLGGIEIEQAFTRALVECKKYGYISRR